MGSEWLDPPKKRRRSPMDTGNGSGRGQDRKVMAVIWVMAVGVASVVAFVAAVAADNAGVF